jgi:hypothetical protein
MNSEEFCRIYWRHYIELEKEFNQTVKYVSLELENFNTFSEAFQKLILQIGSEIDIILKEFCKYINNKFNGDNMNKYLECIKNYSNEIYNQNVINIQMESKMQPWKKYVGQKSQNSWWKAYNEIKHNRTNLVCIGDLEQKGYKFATLENALYILAALYQILINFYYKLALAEKKEILTPIPGSRMFKLCGDYWEKVNFYYDYAFYLDSNGMFRMECGDINY